MNRRDRRAAGKVKRSERPDIPTYLDLHCAGPSSDPPTECHWRIFVPMPLDMEDLRIVAAKDGGFVTMTTPPGQGHLTCTVLCGTCARKLMPRELVDAAERAMPAKS